MPYQDLFERFEKIMLSFDGRSHWAKPHPLGPTQLRRLYPKYDDFIATVTEVDPKGIFRNEYVRRHIFGEVGAQVDPTMFSESKPATGRMALPTRPRKKVNRPS